MIGARVCYFDHSFDSVITQQQTVTPKKEKKDENDWGLIPNQSACPGGAITD